MVDRALEAYNWVSRNTTAIHNLIVAGPARGRPASWVVAASDAPADWIAQADYTCDGTADDVQINAALVAAGAGNVLLSPGTFNCTSTITMATASAGLYGCGRPTIISSSANPAVTGDTDIGSGRISNIAIVETSSSNDCVLVKGSNWQLDHLYISGGDSGIELITSGGTLVGVSIRDCYFTTCVNGIVVGNFDGTIIDNIICSGNTSNDIVLHNATASHASISNLYSLNAGNDIIFADQTFSRININNVTGKGAGHHGIYLERTHYANISNINLLNIDDVGVYVTGDTSGNDSYDVNLNNINVQTAGQGGILVYDVDSVRINNAMLYNCGTHGGSYPDGMYMRYVKSACITNLSIRASADNGLLVEDNVLDLRLLNCSFIDNGQSVSNTYSGVVSNNATNVITMIGCASYNSDGAAGSQKYGVLNTAGTVNSIGSRFSTNHTRDTNGTITTLVGLADT